VATHASAFRSSNLETFDILRQDAKITLSEQGENPMEIIFVNHVPPKITALGTISFQVVVNGGYLWCEISVEALRDHFDATSMRKNDLLQAFYAGRSRIEQTTKMHLEENGGSAVLLTSSNF
jgi:hypothetical protein